MATATGLRFSGLLFDFDDIEISKPISPHRKAYSLSKVEREISRRHHSTPVSNNRDSYPGRIISSKVYKFRRNGSSRRYEVRRMILIGFCSF